MASKKKLARIAARSAKANSTPIKGATPHLIIFDELADMDEDELTPWEDVTWD